MDISQTDRIELNDQLNNKLKYVEVYRNILMLHNAPMIKNPYSGDEIEKIVVNQMQQEGLLKLETIEDTNYRAIDKDKLWKEVENNFYASIEWGNKNGK